MTTIGTLNVLCLDDVRERHPERNLGGQELGDLPIAVLYIVSVKISFSPPPLGVMRAVDNSTQTDHKEDRCRFEKHIRLI